MLHILRFFLSSRCRLFHNAIFFGSCNTHILNTGCAKIFKENSGAKGLKHIFRVPIYVSLYNCRSTSAMIMMMMMLNYLRVKELKIFEDIKNVLAYLECGVLTWV